MRIINDRNLIDDIFNYDTVIVPLSIANSFGTGFTHEISINFQKTVDADLTTGYCDKRKYGTVIVCEDKGITFCLAYCLNQRQNNHCDSIVNIDYLTECLKRIFNHFKDRKKIVFPLIYGNENNEILKVLEDSEADCDVYQYIPRNFGLEVYRKIAELRRRKKDKEIDNNTYIRERSRLDWMRVNGIYNEMPENYVHIPKKDKTKVKIKVKEDGKKERD